MKPFTQVAKPHSDIVKGDFRMEVFAADLWQVVKGAAPDDYKDATLFFKKTYMTKGLKNILAIAEERLRGKIGDAVIQLQTPFGGGKTHTLIALYHKAKEWGTNVVVFDGTALDPKDVRPWEELERQLTGMVKITKGDTSPGKEKLMRLISEHSPILILMDEVLEYITKAAGVKVGDSNLASQTLAFIQELTAAVSSVGNALLVLTLPSSILEHYDENAERMFQQMQKITGRVERIYTPVEDDEIEHVIRARLFSSIDENEARSIVDEFVEYAKNEGLLTGDEASLYRARFLKSYPFKPEVIDVLYKRWGSFPTFQRTRGVLRLLSLVIHDLLRENLPFIRLGDFNLANDQIRRELLKHIGPEWDGIIAQDITSPDSGAKKVDNGLGTSYLPYRLGTVVSTTIFVMSFSGKGERGSSFREIKIATVRPEFSSTVIDTVITNLREKLFYLSDDGLFFSNQPNLNRIIIAREENFSQADILNEERMALETHLSKSPKFRIYIHPKFPKDIPDSPDLKLAILNMEKPDTEFIEKFGEHPRIYRNTLIFLCIDETQRESFHIFLRRKLSLKSIDSDKKLKLTESQRKEVRNKLKIQQQREYEEVRKLYRKLYLPDRNGLKEMDMGIPTFGENFIDREVYEYLKVEGEILEKISSKVIKDKYLGERTYIATKKLWDAFLRTPGEIRLVSKDGYVSGIKEGVKNGLFGLGYIVDKRIECRYINEVPEVSLAEDEILVNPDLCKNLKEGKGEKRVKIPEQEIEKPEEQPTIKPSGDGEKKYSKITLKLDVPVGQISTIVKVVNFLKNRFNRCEIEITIKASEGSINISDYEDKILEALDQGKIKIKEEREE